MGIVASAVKGALAGAVATAAMDVVWYRRYRADGGDRDFATWEFSTTATSFDDDDVPAPARVGKRVADAIGVELPPSSVAPVSNLVHWATGIGWGKVAGLVAMRTALPPLGVGVATGVLAWSASYALLGAIGVYEPITAYDFLTLWRDLSAHLVFGAALGTVLTLGSTFRR
jgi:hypothetical protein